MKKIKFLSLVCLVASMCLFLSFGDTVAADKPTILRISTQMPPNHHTVKALEIFKGEVEKNTQGRISVKIHPAGQLFKGRELPMAVGVGVVEMGDIVTPYLSGIMPELELLDGPFLIDSREIAEKVFSGDIGKMLNNVFKRLGMTVVFGHPYGYFSMYGNNKKVIKVPSDMKGMNIRAVGQIQVLKAKAAGAKPVTVPGSEQYMAYKRGVVDIGQTGPTSFKSRKLFETFKHGTIVRDDLMIFWCVMNLKVWKKLSDADKKIIKAAGEKAADWDWKVIQEKEEDADKFLVTKMQLYFPKGAELEQWKKTFMPVNKVVADNAGKSGRELYQAILKIKEGM